MSISLRGVNNAAGQNNGSTSASTVAITPTLPTGTAAGDRVFVYTAASNTSGTTPTGWTVVGTKDTVLGSGAVGASTGLRYGTWYYRDYDGVWTMPAFSLTSATNNSFWLGAVSVTSDSGTGFAAPTISTVGGAFNATTTSYTDSSAASFTTTTNGLLLIGTGLNTNATSTTVALTQSGATFGTVTERCDGGTATGNDVAGKLHTAPVTVGAAATTTFTLTLSATSQGETLIVQQTENASITRTLVDDFTTEDTGKWTAQGQTGWMSGGQAVLTNATPSFTAIHSNSAINLSNAAIMVQAVSTPNITGAGVAIDMSMSLFSTVDGTDSETFLWNCNAGSVALIFREGINSANSDTFTTYNSTNHKWWQIRYNSTASMIYWETSPDAVVWTVQRAKTPGAIDLTSLNIYLSRGTWMGTDAGGNAVFDNFNTVPVAADAGEFFAMF